MQQSHASTGNAIDILAHYEMRMPISASITSAATLRCATSDMLGVRQVQDFHVGGTKLRSFDMVTAKMQPMRDRGILHT
jgi:hypothetical protein